MMSGKPHKEADGQSGFFASLDESGVGNGEWSHIELVHHSEHGLTHVYKASRYDKLFALKCLKPEYRDDANACALLEKEFSIGYNLRHKNITSTLDFTNVATLGKCVVMEWIDGKALEDYLQDRELSKNQAKSIGLQLCDAVEFLHNHQVIHRDLKPLNVMISAIGNQIKLLDFGLSDTSRFTSFKQPAGTPGYVAPELLSGESNGDVRSDIYSLGVMLRGLHPSLARVARRCTSKNPDDRYQRVSQVRKALTDQKGKWWWAVVLLLALAAIVTFVIQYVGHSQVEKSMVVEDTTAMKTPEEKIIDTLPIEPNKSNNDNNSSIEIHDDINTTSILSDAELKSHDAVPKGISQKERTDEVASAENNAGKEEPYKRPSSNSSHTLNSKAEVGSLSWCESIFLPIWIKHTRGVESPESMTKSRRLYLLEKASIEFKSACEEEFDKFYQEKDREYWIRLSVMEGNMSKVLYRYSN